MDVVWGHGAPTVREVIVTLPHDPAYTTIATVLHNLERKQMVRPVKDGRATRYEPRRSREEHAAGAMQHALASSPDRATSILHFVDAMGDDDLRLLREHLERSRGAR